MRRLKNRIRVLILIVSLTLLTTGAMLVKSSHTNATILTDKSDYGPYETVTISGFCFASNVMVNLEVIRPYGALSCWTVNSDGDGDFVTTYHLDGTAGMYIAKASDGTNGEESAFTLATQVTVPIITSVVTITTDKSDYNPEEVVTIRGSGFQPNIEVDVEIVRPDGIFDLWTVNCDGDGDFVTTYLLCATAGVYIVKACDGINGIETMFTIASQSAIPEVAVASVVTTDKSNYDPEEVILIKGSGFQPNAEVNLEVIRPDGTLSNWLMESNPEGLFFTTYGPDATTGMYIVKASDGISGTEASFTVRSIDF